MKKIRRLPKKHLLRKWFLDGKIEPKK